MCLADLLHIELESTTWKQFDWPVRQANGSARLLLCRSESALLSSLVLRVAPGHLKGSRSQGSKASKKRAPSFSLAGGLIR